MKAFAIATGMILTFFTSVYAQSKYNNKIAKVEQLNIYSPDNRIIIGKLTINQSLETRLYLIRIETIRDSTGKYLTGYTFGNRDRVPVFGVNLKFNFNQDVEVSYPLILNGNPQDETFKIPEKHNSFTYTAGTLGRSPDKAEVILFMFKSAKPLYAEIEGAAGKL